MTRRRLKNLRKAPRASQSSIWAGPWARSQALEGIGCRVTFYHDRCHKVIYSRLIGHSNLTAEKDGERTATARQRKRKLTKSGRRAHNRRARLRPSRCRKILRSQKPFLKKKKRRQNRVDSGEGGERPWRGKEVKCEDKISGSSLT